MSSYFQKRVFIVEFSGIDPNGDNSTAECLAEAYSQSQAESMVISAAKKSGFTRIHNVRSHLANEAEIKRALAAIDEKTNAILPNTQIH